MGKLRHYHNNPTYDSDNEKNLTQNSSFMSSGCSRLRSYLEQSHLHNDEVARQDQTNQRIPVSRTRLYLEGEVGVVSP